MCDVYAHIICAEEVIKALRVKLEPKGKSLLYFGAQGPDIISFIYPELSHKMHDYYDEFLKILLSKKELLPFYIGYLSHFILDRMLHPIINSYSDSLKTHLALEAYFDQVIVKLYWNKDIKDLDLSYFIPYSFPDNVTHFLSEAIYYVYAFKLPLKFWDEALEKFHKIYSEAKEDKSDLIRYSKDPLLSLEQILGKKNIKILFNSFRDSVKNTVVSLSETLTIRTVPFGGVKIKDDKYDF